MKIDIDYYSGRYEITTFLEGVDEDGDDIFREERPHHFFRTRIELYVFLDTLITERVTRDVETI